MSEAKKVFYIVTAPWRKGAWVGPAFRTKAAANKCSREQPELGTIIRVEVQPAKKNGRRKA